MHEQRLPEVVLQNLPKKSHSPPASDTDSCPLSPGPERRHGNGHEDMTFLIKDRGEDREKEVLQDNSNKPIWMQNLHKDLDSLKEELHRAENLNRFSMATIEELQLQKEALQEKVERLEMQQNTKPKIKMQRGKQRREQTVKFLEQEELKKHCTVLNRQMFEAKDRVDFLQEQLNLAEWMNDHSKTIVEKQLEDRDRLSERKNLLMDRIKGPRSKISQFFHRVFWPRENWNKQDINSLLRKKEEIHAQAQDQEDLLEYATKFYNMHEGSIKCQSQEIEQLESQLNELRKWLQKGGTSFFKRKKETEADSTIKKQAREVKSKLKVLRKKLAEVQDSKKGYSRFIVSIQKKREELNKKMKMIEDELLKGRKVAVSPPEKK